MSARGREYDCSREEHAGILTPREEEHDVHCAFYQLGLDSRRECECLGLQLQHDRGDRVSVAVPVVRRVALTRCEVKSRTVSSWLTARGSASVGFGNPVRYTRAQ